MSPTPGHGRTWASAKRGTVPKVFSCGPTASPVQCEIYRGDFHLLLPQCCSSLSGICSTANSPSAQPVFQTQPISLTSDLPCSCAWHTGSSSSTTGRRRRFASLQESTPKGKCHMSLVSVSAAAVPPPHNRTCLARGISLSMIHVGLPCASGNEILVRPAMGAQPAFNEFHKVGHEQDRTTQAATSSDITGRAAV